MRQPAFQLPRQRAAFSGSAYLLRVLDVSKEFCKSVGETVLKAAKRILDLPDLRDWQNEALFIVVDRGGWWSVDA